jgi:DTW domain-containing protein
MLFNVILFCHIAATHSFALQPTSKAYTLDVVRFDETRRGDQEVNAFYKQMKYRKPPLAKVGDVQYTLRGDFIAATVRLSADPASGWMFLRSLCVNFACRRQGLALYLLSLVLDDFSQTHNNNSMTGVYCFLEPSLSPLYVKAGFWESSETLPKSIFHRWMKLNARARAQDLACFQWHAVIIILLQHSKECHRKTGTAHLLSGMRHLRVRTIVWSGRADNDAVQMVLNEYQSDKIVLLWTGSEMSVPPASPGSGATHFLLVDGTWQEAQSMFRKIPQLQGLQRLSLRASAPSMYTLRQNFGWKERFSDNCDSALLCTAEVGAELLHNCGNENGAALVRSRLVDFQDKLVD